MNSTTTGSGNFVSQFYQVWKVLRDPNVPWAAKWLIPLGAFIYWISPVDLIPMFPGDDIVVIFIAMNLFLQMVARYQTTGKGQGAGATDRQDGHPGQSNTSTYDDNKTIETTWRVVND